MTVTEMLAMTLAELPQEAKDNLKWHLGQQTPLGKPDDIERLHATGGA